MGAEKSIPILGETVTALESAAKLVGAGVAGVIGGPAKLITGKDNVVSKFSGALVKGAVDSWVDYSERSLIVAPVRCMVHVLSGESEEARRVFKKCVKSTESFIDNTPGVGHVKGLVHYAAGDTEHGSRCMKGATRGVAVMGAGALTGGVGAGAVLAGTAAVTTGVGYDVAVTEIQSNDDKFEPFGSIADIQRVKDAYDERDEYEYINGVVDTTLGVIGDIDCVDDLKRHRYNRAKASLRKHITGNQ